jgi:hypothetical protein
MKDGGPPAWTKGERTGLVIALCLFLYLLACLLIGPILTALYDCGDGGCLGGGSTKEWIIVT